MEETAQIALTAAGSSQIDLMPSSVKEMVSSSYPSVASLKVAVNTPSVNLCEIKRDYGEEAVLISLIRHIAKLDAFLGLKNGISPEQSLELAKMVMEDFPYITFADFACICNKARRGMYGKMFERLSPSDIYQWVSEYFEERCSYFETESIYLHHENEGNPNRERTKTHSISSLRDLAEITIFNNQQK